MPNLMNDFGKFLSTVDSNEFTVKHGGKRKNAGSKPKYNEPTKTLSFRVPISKIGEIKLLITNKLLADKKVELIENKAIDKVVNINTTPCGLEKVGSWCIGCYEKLNCVLTNKKK